MASRGVSLVAQRGECYLRTVPGVIGEPWLRPSRDGDVHQLDLRIVAGKREALGALLEMALPKVSQNVCKTGLVSELGRGNRTFRLIGTYCQPQRSA